MLKMLVCEKDYENHCSARFDIGITVVLAR
jgi:hypothetical protein